MRIQGNSGAQLPVLPYAGLQVENHHPERLDPATPEGKKEDSRLFSESMNTYGFPFK